jgi:hypothetical protein
VDGSGVHTYRGACGVCYFSWCLHRIRSGSWRAGFGLISLFPTIVRARLRIFRSYCLLEMHHCVYRKLISRLTCVYLVHAARVVHAA